LSEQLPTKSFQFAFVFLLVFLALYVLERLVLVV